MELNPLITEQTTAASDVLLALVSIGGALGLLYMGRADRRRANTWAAAFGLVAVGAVLGAVAHGCQWSPEAQHLLWQPLFLSLGLSIAMFVVGVIHDRWGSRAAQRALPVAVFTGLGFYLLTVLVPRCFLLFALLQLSAMTFAAFVYAGLAVRNRCAGFALAAAGIALSIFAAIVQTRHSVSLTLIWEFDHNGVYHLIQMPGLLFLAAGLCASFPNRAAKRAELEARPA